MMSDDDNDSQYISEEYVSPVTVELPGKKVDIPIHIIKQLQRMWYDGKKRLSFFGGHPVSITKLSCNQIFSARNQNKQSPYLVCQKTDGVRYLLIVAKVSKSELIREVYQNEVEPFTQCYLVSRQGQGKLVAYVVQMAISHHLEAAATQVGNQKRSVIQILDGELIKEGAGQIRYLAFDALVHLGRNICPLPLRERLNCISSFIRCNEMLNIKPSKIEMRMKDFFRLTSPKFNITQFMIKKYVKCLPHQNDGIIFNHEDKPYLLGTTNNGYVKWKPAHLNTVDFMIVPNQNLEENVGRRVLDLYLAIHNIELERYIRQFYAFAVVSETDYAELLRNYEENQANLVEEMERNQNENVSNNEFAGAIIAECRYQTTKGQQRSILSQLHRIDDNQLCRSIMKQGDDNIDRKAIKDLKFQVYDKGWKIYKLRPDKSLPNNIQVAKKIQQSIRDGISETQLIKGNQRLNKQNF